MRELRRVGVFCGSSAGNQQSIHTLARELGATLAQQGIGLVYGGGQVGVMGMLADAVLETGGEAIGVLPNGLFSREVPHDNLTQLHLVDSMHDRKRLMYDLSDGFVVLPGGLGTLDELFEAATWNQLRLHEPLKPITLLDQDGFWSALSRVPRYDCRRGLRQSRPPASCSSDRSHRAKRSINSAVSSSHSRAAGSLVLDGALDLVDELRRHDVVVRVLGGEATAAAGDRTKVDCIASGLTGGDEREHDVLTVAQCF